MEERGPNRQGQRAGNNLDEPSSPSTLFSETSLQQPGETSSSPGRVLAMMGFHLTLLGFPGRHLQTVIVLPFLFQPLSSWLLCQCKTCPPLLALHTCLPSTNPMALVEMPAEGRNYRAPARGHNCAGPSASPAGQKVEWRCGCP